MSSLAPERSPGWSARRVQKYGHIFTLQLANSLAYPGELVGRSLMILPFLWIFAQLWRVTFAAAGTEVLNGLTLRDTLWYLVLAESIELSRPRIGTTISEAVKDGSIAYALNKPYNFLLYHFSASLGETVFRAGMVLLFGSLMASWLVGPHPDALGFLAAAPAVLGAWTLNFCLSAIIALAAFVTEDVTAFFWIYQKFLFIFGGLLIPLDFYPAWLQNIAHALPFSAMLYAPARLFVSPTPEVFANTLGVQLAWTAGLGLLTALVYRAGVSRLTLNGG